MGRHVVVMGASAGGVEALRAVVAGLPGDLPAPGVVVLAPDLSVRVLGSPLTDHDDRPTGAILMMEETAVDGDGNGAARDQLALDGAARDGAGCDGADGHVERRR